MMLKVLFYLAVFCGIFAESARVKHLKVACKKSDEDFSKCLLGQVESYRPLLVRGIPEINFPPLDPFELPFVFVNQSLGDLVQIEAIIKNVKVTGGANTKIEHLMFDPNTLTGEIRLTVPQQSLEMDYKVHGGIISIPLESEGFMRGNFSKTQIYMKGSLKTEDRNGVKYYQVKKLSSKIRVGDGFVEMISKNPDLQFAADLIAKFYNENPQRFMDAVNPIFVETSNDIFVAIINQILDSLPAAEWTPDD